MFLNHTFNSLETFGNLDCPTPNDDEERTREHVARINEDNLTTCRNTIFTTHNRPFASTTLHHFFYHSPHTMPNTFNYPKLEFNSDWTLIHFAPNPS